LNLNWELLVEVTNGSEIPGLLRHLSCKHSIKNSGFFDAIFFVIVLYISRTTAEYDWWTDWPM